MTKRAGKKKPRSPGEVRTTANRRSPNPIATGNGKPVKAELVPSPPEYTFVGSGADAALITNAIKNGWNISVEARRRISNRIEEQANSKDLSLKDLDRITTMIQRCDKASIEAEKLRMFAQMNAFESEVVQKTTVAKPEEKLVEAMLESCTTPEQARWLLNVARSIAS